MSGAWTENGPISLPTRPLVMGAAAAVAVFALLGAAAGFSTAVRRASAPDLNAEADQAAGKDDALIARPVVDLAPPAPPPDQAKNAAADADEEAKADALAAQTAAAQAIQAKPSKSGGDIDDVLASPSEKPPTPTKAGADEAPPGSPVKSDVPF